MGEKITQVNEKEAAKIWAIGDFGMKVGRSGAHEVWKVVGVNEDGRLKVNWYWPGEGFRTDEKFRNPSESRKVKSEELARLGIEV